MNFKDILLTASSNMFRSKLRTALTILAIFIGAFTLTLTNGIGAGISSYVNKQVGNLGQQNTITITAKPASSSGVASTSAPQKYQAGQFSTSSGHGPGGDTTILLTSKDISALRTDKDLSNVQPTYIVSPDYIQGSSNDKYKLTTSIVSPSTKLDLAAGSQLAAHATNNQIVLPVAYASVLGYGSASTAVGKTATLAVTDATGVQHMVTATIVGVQQKGLVGSDGAVLNDTLKNNLYDLQSTGLPSATKDKYAAATASIVGSLSDQHLSQIKKHLNDLGYGGQTLQDRLGTFKTVINAITYILDAFAVIALLAASFGIVNTLLMSVQERTKEIGLMKAMGMRSGRIFTLFSLEAVLIGFWGSAIGVSVAMLVGTVANKIIAKGLLKDLPGFNLLSFPIKSIALIMLLIMAIAFLAGTLPARRASKQNPIDALRYE